MYTEGKNCGVSLERPPSGARNGARGIEALGLHFLIVAEFCLVGIAEELGFGYVRC